ncbi:DUF554 domain-containing protein [Dictyoglomus thermophilum]|uniref:Membrane protein n=1 Tax=Dictyoglomus thermophilum (strain ATCC 35947 / DSM 3960 / H-6-12) TaxID=309799 RepID=B5YFE2_DICT6|nr:DUF554 domain-containing protein [Dictyoglomus thermophilum]ACI19573.1 putative membrane protein [Dictyoglomus thermophilum H-6-12]
MGTIFNSIAVIIGGLIGTIFKKRIPESLQKLLMDSLGLICLPLGMGMAIKGEKFLALVFSIVVGAIIGELLKIHDGLEKLSLEVEKRFAREQNTFAKGFLTATLLYCIGPMTIMGSLQDGLGQTPQILYTKALLDGTASIALASALGVGVIFSSISVLIVQGGITLFAKVISPLFTPIVIQEMTAVGGVLILGIALNLLNIKQIKVANLLPALFLIPIFIHIFP